jgi:cell wall-associated NlpC family hydrolase
MNADRYIGIPFKVLGRDHGGCDCWGLTRLMYMEELGIMDLPSLSYEENYQPDEIQSLVDEVSQNWVPVTLGDEKPWDVLVLRSINPHIGVVVKRGKMIHIQTGTDSCLENYKTSQWNRRILGIYRHAKLT